MRPLPWRKETSPFIHSARIAGKLYVKWGVGILLSKCKVQNYFT